MIGHASTGRRQLHACTSRPGPLADPRDRLPRLLDRQRLQRAGERPRRPSAPACSCTSRPAARAHTGTITLQGQGRRAGPVRTGSTSSCSCTTAEPGSRSATPARAPADTSRCATSSRAPRDGSRSAPRCSAARPGFPYAARHEQGRRRQDSLKCGAHRPDSAPARVAERLVTASTLAARPRRPDARSGASGNVEAALMLSAGRRQRPDRRVGDGSTGTLGPYSGALDTCEQGGALTAGRSGEAPQSAYARTRVGLHCARRVHDRRRHDDRHPELTPRAGVARDAQGELRLRGRARQLPVQPGVRAGGARSPAPSQSPTPAAHASTPPQYASANTKARARLPRRRRRDATVAIERREHRTRQPTRHPQPAASPARCCRAQPPAV